MSTPTPPVKKDKKKAKPAAVVTKEPLEPAAAEEARRAEQRRRQSMAWVRITKAAMKGDVAAKAIPVPKKVKTSVQAVMNRSERKTDLAARGATQTYRGTGAGKSTAVPDGRFDPCWICGERCTFKYV